MPVAEIAEPSAVFAWHDGDPEPVPLARHGDRWSSPALEVEVRSGSGATAAVHLSGGRRPLRRVVLRWDRPTPGSAVVLGDAWERSYGDLQWRHLQPERLLPWYWLSHDPTSGGTTGMGVVVRPGALCAWTVDVDGISLWLDVRSGGAGVDLGGRALHAATLRAVQAGPERSAWEVLEELCELLCSDPVLPAGPLVGCNNWYYAYGTNFDAAAVLRDAETMAEMADGHTVRPYCVIDAGWSPGGVAPGGPWTDGLPGVFDDMAGLATSITGRGARPGLWFRPLLWRVADPRARSGPVSSGEWPLDPSRPDTLEGIAADVRRFVGWGFELLKHDFSTFDLFDRFGPAMGVELTSDDWHLARRDLTNAEVLVGLYRTIRDAAGDAVVIGCNTVGHLAAGLVHSQRTGDDTSGRDWERTRRMGVNTLAFRLPQHRRFFALDADCVPCTPQTDWALNRRFLDVVARSGTALWVSVDPAARSAGVDADLRAGIRLALDGGEPGGVRPLDWMQTTTPETWQSASGTHHYSWAQPWGSWPGSV